MSVNIGAFNAPLYDNCNYQQYVRETTSPFDYLTYFGAAENCSRCVFRHFWRRFDVVDIESELRNQTRPQSKCNQYKYNPKCSKSGLCTSTYSVNVPIVIDPSICPPVSSNILKPVSIGYKPQNQNFCRF